MSDCKGVNVDGIGSRGDRIVDTYSPSTLEGERVGMEDPSWPKLRVRQQQASDEASISHRCAARF